MNPDNPNCERYESGLLPAARRTARENGAGVAGTLVLHALLLFLTIFTFARLGTRPIENLPHVLPVDLVRLGEETRSPPAALRSPVPQERAGRPQQAASPVDAGVSPSGARPVPDDAIAAKLRALARLRQPDTPLKLAAGEGVSNVDASNGAAGGAATYSIRDYVLAQILRRWTLDLKKASEPLVIPLVIVMKRDGTIASAEIVEQKRAKADARYRDVAIGARNAALLSSPIALPPGDYPKEMRFILMLDTRAVMR